MLPFSLQQIWKSNRTIWWIIGAGFILRIINANQSFWLDEAAQVLESIRPFSQQWDIPNDFQPPLFHYWVHFFTYISTTERWLRLASIIPGVATVYGVFLIVKKLTNPVTALLAAFLMATAPYHIYYSQELRPYALATFWATFSIYFLITQRWRWYTVTIVGGMYSLYLFPFLIVAQLLWVLQFQPKQLVSFIRSLLIAGVLFLPWTPQLFRQLTGGMQLPEIWPQWRQLSSVAFWKVIPLTYAKFVLGRITFENNFVYGSLVAVSLPFFSLPIINALLPLNDYWQAFKKVTKKLSLKSIIVLTVTKLVSKAIHRFTKQSFPQIYLIFLWLVIPFVIAIIISIWLPLNGPWRLLFVLPSLYVLISIGIMRNTNRIFRHIMLYGVLTANLFGSLVYHSQSQFHRENWRESISFLQQQITASDNAVVINAFPEPFAPIEWYASPDFPVYGVLDGLIAEPAAINQNLTRITQNAQTVYRFEYLEGLTDSSHLIDSWLKNNDFIIVNTYDFSGVGFIHVYQRYGAYASINP